MSAGFGLVMVCALAAPSYAFGLVMGWAIWSGGEMGDSRSILSPCCPCPHDDHPLFMCGCDCHSHLDGGVTDSDVLLHEANRAANRLAKACLVWHEHERNYGYPRQYMPFDVLREYDRALANYREAQRRAQMEATG